MQIIAVLVVAMLVAGGCGLSGASPSAPPRTLEVVQMPDLTPDLTAGPTPDPDEAPGAPSPAAVDLPADILGPILDDAADRSGVPRDQLVVTRAEAVTWPDGGLGCPEPGVMYIQVLVDGYWVVIHTGKQELDYRGDGRGGFRLCTSEHRDRQLPVNPGGGGGAS